MVPSPFAHLDTDARLNTMQSTTPTPASYKPSPLSFNSPRQSPFRRPGSIREASPSTLRPSTPNSSPLKPREPPTPTTPSQVTLRPAAARPASPNPPSWLNTRGTTSTPEPPSSPLRNLSPARNASSTSLNAVRPLSTASIAAKFESAGARDDTPPPLSIRKPSPPLDYQRPLDYSKPLDYPKPAAEKPVERLAVRQTPMPRIVSNSSDALSKLPPPLLHSMRESFSVMDRDDDGHVNAGDVADMLSQLGLSATPSQLHSYFNGAPSINLATYLSTLSDLLGNLSHSSELSAAFEAFDDNDDGQIDLSELKDALLHTAPEPGEKKLTEREIDMVIEGFSGRGAFGKGGRGAKGLGRTEVFRYQEFMDNLTGGGNTANGADGTSVSA
ncbi:hypothetical protein CFE70_008526 [Pyrenophora teres f. teres 0-1]|uniref:EF-hand domain-containing protein n=2 Tax=Pyrenophora teres f. teres TaxID=97479 RepID=E3RFI1_PYRTT|nr:hypothetical protein PTT_06426 [Pyrenophora teres f. teres 0-1]KAE8822179.1 hypothetical protein HRS9139_10442 [Pyrenophora teres f. teres]KAE8822482.1 hypothetical protein PTNB85_10368 [Pyrenophora teres f. teres]KAE8858691.1 hypothetical protein PTNB29_07906 [Pyrenophora teres f. teres]KAE8861466.1 hypothetical protein PTNB73_07020 [Pyrenophora teres f. teres]